MFRGISSISIDSKGRMVMPARYREHLQQQSASQVVVTIDTEATCLLLYPLPAWEEIERKIEALPSFNNVTRRIQRLLIGHATELELDGSGRILLPPLLREYAKLDKHAVLIGQGKKFEMWDENEWQSNRAKWLEASDTTEIPQELSAIAL